MSIRDDTHSTTNPSVIDRVHQHPQDETTCRKAINKIRKDVRNTSDRRLHVYSFNVREDQLESAYNLLDKQDHRKRMRVTYSDDHNFIVRYMPSPVHEGAHGYWFQALSVALTLLTAQPHAVITPGCDYIGSTTFQLGPRKKEADSGVRPANSRLPSVVLEVGDSESLTQLKIDARLWLEHMPEIQLVILVLIDPPGPSYPNLPRITIQLWRGFASSLPPHLPMHQQRIAHMVWESAWTLAATPFYILLSDIFRGQIPDAYGSNDRVQLDAVAWRQDIVDAWQFYQGHRG